ncbi:MAG: hypothetical protein WD929_00295 [Steroidobacteraceae bacterium]
MSDFEKLGAFYIGRGYDARQDALAARTAEREELPRRIDQEATDLTSSLDANQMALTRLRIAPRKSDIAIGRIAIAWEPWRAGADGLPRPASVL